MIRKVWLAVAVLALLPLADASRAYAEEPTPGDAQGTAPADVPGTAEPTEPDGQPYPPDGVTDPNAAYPTDGAGDTTDPGEAGALPPDAPGSEAPAPGGAPPD